METHHSKNLAALGLSFGVGEGDVSILTPSLAYTRMLKSSMSFSAKITWASADGDLGSNSGPGDLYLSGAYLKHLTAPRTVAFSAGVKLPLSTADKGDEIPSLPMAYQTSLETTDLILGTALSLEKLRFSLGWQQPLTAGNSNSFFPTLYPKAGALEFEAGNQFKRSGDVLLRIAYEMDLAQKRLIFHPGLLAIYHLSDDSFVDLADIERKIDGSQGMTLNGNLSLDWQINSQYKLNIYLGAPFITRDARPDGLTRHFVLGTELAFTK